MSTDETKNCTDLNIGKLIFAYEMGTLGDADRDRFDEHLMTCNFCCGELDEMCALAPALREHHHELAEFLRVNGVSLEDEIETAAVARPRHRFTLWDSIRQAIEAFMNPRIFAPALMAAAALVLVVTVATRDRESDQYSGYLSFDKLPYQTIEGRGTAVQESQDYLHAMDDYAHGDYEKAISRLKQVTGASPEDESAWVYLGVSYFMTKHPGRAISALQHARQLPDRQLNTQTCWFLAQAFLMKGEKERALPLLDSLSLWNREYSQPATDLRKRLNSSNP